ncbi:MAG: HEAT repeat domain-containing protein, partial [Kiritimatiellales bacterium]
LVEALGRDLSADEVRSLIMFIHARPEQVGLTENDYNAVGDVVLLKLEDQKQLPADYSDHLVVMFHDQSLNPTWRDYCIQHLGTVCPRVALEKQPVIRQLYLDALEPGSRFAGTTLLSMKRSAGTPGLTKEFVAEKAMAVASSDAYGDAERLSALHVAAEFNDPNAVQLARQIAGSKHTALFRSASLAVLGMAGDETDRPLLEKYVKSSDIRLRVAAAEALKKLAVRD